jgi:hypothetical protein
MERNSGLIGTDMAISNQQQQQTINESFYTTWDPENPGQLITVPGDPEMPAIIKRMQAYQVEEELNCLYDDIKAGLFGEPAKTGSFMAYLDSVKSQYPKE